MLKMAVGKHHSCILLPIHYNMAIPDKCHIDTDIKTLENLQKYTIKMMQINQTPSFTS